jgi:Na+/H+ antiporter NhaC
MSSERKVGKVKRNPNISEGYFGSGFRHMLTQPAFWVFTILILISYGVGNIVNPTYTIETATLDVKLDKDNGNKPFYIFKGKPKYISQIVPQAQSKLTTTYISRANEKGIAPSITEEYIGAVSVLSGKSVVEVKRKTVKSHYGWWSFLPALVAIILCWVTKEPISALGGGILSGALILRLYDLTGGVLIPQLMKKSSASVLLLYLLLLGGLLGIWSKTGAAQAFADLMTKHFVRGPRSAKFVAWLLGVIFHQGGTMSTVLVGTTVKPLADKERVSHEELSYIVDSTASPIASLIPINAWPGYVQALIFVSGASWLATESDRILFFVKSIPISFYSIFAVTMTFLISFDKLPFVGKQMSEAMHRARTTGELDAPGSEPLSSKELSKANDVPKGYKPHVSEFLIPIGIIFGISIGTFVITGSPEVHWGFGIALFFAMGMALLRGMKLKNMMGGLENGLKGVVVGAVILLFAMTIGDLSKSIGGGAFMVELLGDSMPFWLLPITLQLLTMIISFSTGTSWGTYAVAFPLAMPLAYAVATANGLANPELYTLICFATVLNGSVYGDQCSPISDTTVLSAMVTGCDLMDHVKTQMLLASIAAAGAAILWTLLTFIAAYTTVFIF